MTSVSFDSDFNPTCNYDLSSKLASMLSPYLLTTVAPARRELLTESGHRRQLTAPQGVIKQPTICIKVGASVVFDTDTTNKIYPVYQRNSLLNSNSNFDYGEFITLAEKINSGVNITQFIYTFSTSGVYVFAFNNVNDTNNEKYVVFGV